MINVHTKTQTPKTLYPQGCIVPPNSIKDLKLKEGEIQQQIQKTEHGFIIELRSKTFQKDVFYEVTLHGNCGIVCPTEFDSERKLFIVNETKEQITANQISGDSIFDG